MVVTVGEVGNPVEKNIKKKTSNARKRTPETHKCTEMKGDLRDLKKKVENVSNGEIVAAAAAAVAVVIAVALLGRSAMSEILNR